MNIRDLSSQTFAVAFGLALSATALVAADEVPPAQPAPSGEAAPPTPANSATQWLDIKDCTFDTRARFFEGLEHLETRVDQQINELTAKRASMPSTVDTKEWDFAMKEMVNARAYLKSTGEVLAKASPETWTQEKEKVGQAWVRTQDAYSKVKASTTL